MAKGTAAPVAPVTVATDALAAASDASSVVHAAAGDSFAKGARVLISGLQRRADLNGLCGIVTQSIPSSGRWGVKILPHYMHGQVPEENISCSSANLTLPQLVPGAVVSLLDQSIGILLCKASADMWTLLRMPQSSHSHSFIEHLQASTLKVVAPFFEDTCFPPGISALELQDLVVYMWSSKDQFLEIIQEAFRACATSISPSVPDASAEILADLVEALADHSDRGDFSTQLRLCALDKHAWTALRLADHRLAMEAPRSGLDPGRS